MRYIRFFMCFLILFLSMGRVSFGSVSNTLDEVLSDLDTQPKRDFSLSVSAVHNESSVFMEGVSFELKDSEGRTVKSWVSVFDSQVIELPAPGVYTLAVIGFPPGYFTDSESFIIDTADGDNLDLKVRFDDTRVLFRISDDTRKGIRDISFGVYDESGAEVYSFISSGEPVNVYNLPAGNYTLKQLSDERGYVMEEPLSFEVYGERRVSEYAVRLSSRRLVINIYDDSENRILNRYFSIRDKSGNDVAKLYSQEDGYLVKGIPYGDYELWDVTGKLSDFSVKSGVDVLDVHIGAFDRPQVSEVSSGVSTPGYSEVEIKDIDFKADLELYGNTTRLVKGANAFTLKLSVSDLLSSDNKVLVRFYDILSGEFLDESQNIVVPVNAKSLTGDFDFTLHIKGDTPVTLLPAYYIYRGDGVCVYKKEDFNLTSGFRYAPDSMSQEKTVRQRVSVSQEVSSFDTEKGVDISGSKNGAILPSLGGVPVIPLVFAGLMCLFSGIFIFVKKNK